ncbi:pseudouridine synthase [Mycoplasma sp. Mirounga ES2805-ORL]|uniref:pseudouridine synthase n=1 Tax=Mycoplasma sp. Mirounga ES2805-ORL TaxID=754514 RepID=UPI00197BCD01|nr:pseudouridine synthase [Mycoplasma sp. Mirounga ES2805-ORL]QSF13711.1 rRNA pseudouridine synthase [Mycoplasma sp. Mirounga ES2805-ORL]
MELARLQKIIAASGFCSRRRAEELIKDKRVTVNGNIASLGDKASVDDEIKVNNKLIVIKKNNFEYFILNKPRKTISSSNDEHNRQTVVDLINTKSRIVPVGRLDYNTTGVLLLTDDLEIVNKLTHPKYEIERVYRVRIDTPLTLKEFNELNSGVGVNGKMSYQVVDQVEEKSYTVKLHVGSYHHVKKLFEHFDRKVLNLKRISFANLKVDKIAEGTYRKLTLKELKDLKAIIRSKDINK